MAETKKSFYSNLEDLQFESLVYPYDLNPENFYPDCVCFTIQKRTGVSIDALTSSAQAASGTFEAGWNKEETALFTEHPELKKRYSKAVKDNKAGSDIARQEQILQQVSEEYFKGTDEDGNLNFPGGAPTNMFELLAESIKSFGKHMRGHQQTALRMAKEGRNIIGSIYLNMPNGISFDEKASWGGTELGFMGKATKDVFTGQGGVGETAMGALAGSAGNIVGAAVGAIPSLVSKLGIQGGMFGAAIGAMAAGGPMQKGAEAALGVAQNPYMEMMFSGVGFRSFQFEFIMRPKSEPEIDEVSEILRTFRTFTKPTYTESGLGKSFMDYPMEFGIEFLTWAGGDYSKGEGPVGTEGHGGNYIQNKYVPKLKTCVCDSVTSNYTPQSIWAAHRQGAPVAVTLGLSFQETELVMAEDVHKKQY